MRIEHIRLHNLNSLVGTWEIDLTAPAYRDDNLYRPDRRRQNHHP